MAEGSISYESSPVGAEPKARKKDGRGKIDKPFLILTLVILTIGVIMVLSASFARAYYVSGNPTQYFVRQLIFALGGVVLMLCVTRIPASTYRRWAFPLLIVSMLFLVLVPFIGKEANGSRRWIDLGVTTFQPSELAKLAEILAFAVLICKFKGKMATFKYGVLPFALIAGAIVVLLLLEPHISASVIIIGIAGIMMFAGGTKYRWFVLVILTVGLAGIVLVTKFPYASSRISAWLDPESDPLDSGFQILQSLYAIGSGGMFGVGLGQGRQKYLYLPEEHNDYIFSVFCEELGFAGAALLLLLFALLIIRGFWLAMRTRTRFGSLVITGITGLLAMQVFLNVGVCTNLLPSTGISLPFFSYGGTALLLQLMEMGIILGISRDIPAKKEG